MSGRRRAIRSILGVGAAAAAAWALGACAAHPQSVFRAAGPVDQKEIGLMALSLWIMVGVFAIVAFLLIFALIRYRERPGDTHTPKQVEGSLKLELLWTIVPFLLLVIMAVPTFADGFALAAKPSGTKTLQVTVVGHQWWWEFDYPAQNIVTADELHIPVGYKIELTLKSADVLHSFWVPALGGKEDTVPGRTNTMWLEASQAGVFPGQCAEFCGTGHADMRLLAIAQSPSQFNAWVQQMQNPTPPQSQMAKAGMAVFGSAIGQCSTCHSIDGTPFDTGTRGPNLTDLGNHLTVAGATLQNTPADIVQWINNPQAYIPGTIMPTFQGILTPTQEQELAAYLESLK